MRYVCLVCAGTAASDGTCGKCQAPYMDLEDPKQREAVQLEEDRHRDRRSALMMKVGVLAGIVIVIALPFLVPGYWELRRRAFALPFFLDQIALMAVIGGGLHTWLSRRIKPRFPQLS